MLNRTSQNKPHYVPLDGDQLPYFNLNVSHAGDYVVGVADTHFLIGVLVLYVVDVRLM